VNPPNNIQNGFFTPVSPFFIKIRKLTVFFRVTLTPRLYHNLSVCGWDADGSFAPKTRRSASSACPLQFFGNKKNHMPDARGACRAYDWDLMGSNSFHRLRTPSTACGRSPSLEEGGLGGFASSRRFLYNSGCRVETLLVSKGVMGFLGDLREDRSRARPVGGSARRSIPSEREQPCCDL